MKKQKNASGGPLLLGVLLFAAIAVWMVRGVRDAARLSDEEGLRLAQEAINRAVISCYSLECAYPATYEDLKAKSGLAIDEEKYIVIYEVFGSNIRPTVIVMERQVDGP